MSYLLTALAAYAVGAIPFGYIVYYLITGTDVRTVGSGNIGATNVGRVLGFRFFVLVFVLDLLKGLLPTLGLPWLAVQLGVPASRRTSGGRRRWRRSSATTSRFTSDFEGGKGVATSLGALLALDPIACARGGRRLLRDLLHHAIRLALVDGRRAGVRDRATSCEPTIPGAGRIGP